MQQKSLISENENFSIDEHGRVLIESDELLTKIVGAYSEGINGELMSGLACSNGCCH